jgi:hypothetical protein
MAQKRPPGLIYDEADIDAVTRTMLGEAAGEGADGLAAVAHVLVNRLENGGYGSSLYKVAHAPKQFSAWNSGALGGNNLVNMSADDPRYQEARAIAEQVLNGQLQDNTGGAVNYFAPAGMTGKKGTRKGAPSWADDMAYTTTIGGHQFYSDDSAAGAAERMARGPDVASLQRQLASRGFNPGPIDGINGPKTKAAVRAFQQANGLTVDGIVGPQTMAALNRAGSSRPTTLPQPPGGMRPPPTLPPPPLIPNEMMPERAQFWQEAGGPQQGFKPLPAPPPLTPQASDPNGMIGLGNGVGFGPGWDTLNTLKDISAGVYDRTAPPVPMPGRPAFPGAPSAPVPMPGRPGALNNVAPPSVPAPRNDSAPAQSAQPAQEMVRLPSGKMAPLGTQVNPATGNTITISRGPDGMGVVKIHRSGFIDIGSEMNAPTLAGAFIRSKIPEAAQSAVNNFGPAMDNVKSSAVNAINTVAPTFQGLGNTVGGMFGGLMGMLPGSATPKVPGSAFTGGWGSRPPAPMPFMPSPMLRSNLVPDGGSVYGQPTYRQAPSVPAPRRPAPRNTGRWEGVLDEFGMII